jgi:hypothetical protein
MSLRSFLYAAARSLGDYNAVSRALKTKSLAPIGKRIERRMIGRLFARLLSAITH